MRYLIITAVLSIFISSALTRAGSGQLRIQVARSMSEQRKIDLRQISERIESLRFEPSQTSVLFRKFFGTKETALVQYLNERVKILLDDNDESSYKPPLFFRPEAINLGTTLWFSALMRGNRSNEVKINNETITINSPRVGLIQLYDEFFRQPVILQISTLIHEARHSDCFEIIEDTSHKNSTCGYPHDSGGAMGKDRDRFAWGAYAASYIFGEAIANACLTCSEEEKFLGLLIWSDSRSRIHDLEGMTRGDSLPHQ